MATIQSTRAHGIGDPAVGILQEKHHANPTGPYLVIEVLDTHGGTDSWIGRQAEKGIEFEGNFYILEQMISISPEAQARIDAIQDALNASQAVIDAREAARASVLTALGGAGVTLDSIRTDMALVLGSG